MSILLCKINKGCIAQMFKVATSLVIYYEVVDIRIKYQNAEPRNKIRGP